MQPNESQFPKSRVIPSAVVRDICGGISLPTLDRWQAREDLGFPRPIKIGQRRFWREAELTAWLASREVAA